MTSENEQEKALAVVNYIRKASELTPRKAIDNSALISDLKREANGETFSAISNLLGFLDSSLNVTNKLTTPQAMEIVYMILDKFGDLHFDELPIAFLNGKMGVYGKSNKTYNRLDIEIVSGWLQEYRQSDVRMEYIERKRYAYKAPVNPAELTDENKECLTKIGNLGRELEKKFKLKETAEAQAALATAPNDKNLGELDYQNCHRIYGTLTDDELKAWSKRATTAGFTKTTKFIKEVLERRKKNVPKGS